MKVDPWTPTTELCVFWSAERRLHRYRVRRSGVISWWVCDDRCHLQITKVNARV